MPKVSVVIPSYNHSRYIRECLQSVLDQTWQDFEIVITDDGSSDGSVEIIKQFADPRICLFVHPVNRGACAALNNCIRQAGGQYIAILNSDDAWEPDKLEKQVTYLDEHAAAGAVFTHVSFIDEDSRQMRESDYKFFHVFDQENRTRYAWLNRFFYLGNCLCHPSVLIRKSCYDDIGLYDERMANIPDLDMWVRLCLKYDIYVLDEKLVRFRILKNEANASAANPTTSIRARFEFKQILHHYLKIKDKEYFLKVFPDAVKYGEVENEYIPYFFGRLALDDTDSSAHLWGLEVLYSFIGNNGPGLAAKYDFHHLDFMKLTARYDVFNIAPLLYPQTGLNNSRPGRNILLKAAIRVHWGLATLARKYILK